MPDYQRVVEFLRDFRSSPVQQVTDEVRQHAAAYADLCAGANERLRECSALLGRGLRSEAVHLAEQTPNLLELVAALDLPDPQAWAEFCQQYELAVPPPLQMERAVQLEDAYGQDASVEQLLAQHRRMALCRAPIGQRLEVMRSLQAADGSPFWESDIRQFEKVRQRELWDQLANGNGQRDPAALIAIIDEVRESPWIEPVNEELGRLADEISRELLLTQVGGEMKRFRVQLREAYAARSHKQCAAILNQIRQTLQSADLSKVSEELAAELKPIIAFVRQEEQREAKQLAYSRAVAELTRRLDEDAPTPVLEAAHEKLLQQDQPPPEALEQRYQDRLTAREQTSQRNYRVRLATVAALLLISGGVAGVLLYQNLRSRSADAWAARIEAANEQRNLPAAQRLIDEQQRVAPGLSSHARLADAARETEQLQRRFEADQSALEALLATLDRQEQRAAQLLGEASTAELLAAATATREMITGGRARAELAWADTDGRLNPALRSLDARYYELRQRAGAALSEELLALGRQIDAVSPAEFEQGFTQLDRITAAAIAYRDHPDLDEPSRQAVRATLERIEQRRGLLEQARAHAGELDAIRARAGSARTLAAALEAFVERHPQSPVARDFTAAAQVAAAARAIEEWNSMTGPWRDSLEVGNLRDAEQRVAALTRYIEDYPNGPKTRIATDYRTYLEQAVNVLAVRGTWLLAFQDMLTTPMIADLAYLQTSDGNRYYVLGDVRLRTRTINERRTITFEAIDPQNLARRQEISIEPPAQLLSETPAPAPHARFAAESLQQMRSINERTWEHFGFDFIDRIIANEEIDIVVAAILLQQALKTHSQIVGWAVGDLYERSLTDLARQDVQNIIWYNAAQPVPQITRDALRAIMDEVPPAEVARQQLAQRKQELFDAVHVRYSGSGVVLRDPAGQWSLHVPGRGVRGQTAYAVRLSGRRTVLTPVATRQGDRFDVEDRAMRGIPEGTIVFITD